MTFFELQHIRELKKKGHQYIDELVEAGLTKSEIYGLVKRKLMRKYGKEHFGRMWSQTEVEQALHKLKQLHLKHVRKQGFSVYTESLEEIRRVGRENSKRHTWYRRLLRKIKLDFAGR